MEGPELPVLHDDAALVIINKPPGVVVEPGGSEDSVVELLAARLPPFDVEGLARPGVVHRLDRETSGCLVLARTDEAVAAIDRAFQEKRVDKRYWTLVLGEAPEQGRLEGPYGRDPKDPRKYTTRVSSARRAALSFEVRERLRGATLLEVKLETGRTHQIRVQLSEAGLPVLGDAIYGPAEARCAPGGPGAGTAGAARAPALPASPLDRSAPQRGGAAARGLPARPGAAAQPQRGRRLRPGRLRASGAGRSEDGALSQCALHRERAPVGIDDGFGDGEPQAHALAVGGLHLEVAVEEAGQVLGGDAGAGVPHAELHALCARRRRGRSRRPRG